MAEKGIQVSATIPREWNAAIEEHHWKIQTTKTGLVKIAIQEYLERNDLIPTTNSTEPSGDTA